MEKKSPSASPAFSVREFFARFPNEEACLDHIMAVRYGGTRFDCPKCGVVDATFHRLARRRAYSCAACGYHVYPTAGTILQDTRTPLVSWFYAIYLFTTTRHGVSGKELQRQLGVTYKTAWRMGQQIRDLMGKADINVLLTGHVEADEAYIGGVRLLHKGGKRGRGAVGKTIVFGLKERGGLTAATVLPNVKPPPDEQRDEQTGGGGGTGSAGTSKPNAEIVSQLLGKFPDFDPSWPDDIKAIWFAGFDQFMAGIKGNGG